MMRKFKQVTLQIIAGVNIATIIILLMTGYSGWLRPETFPMLSNIGLLLPVLIVINLGFLVFWVIIKSRGMLIPIAGFLLSYVPVRQYCPVNIPQSAPTGSFKVLSYNVWQFGNASHPNPILEYIKAQKADIVCLQEANINALGGQYVDSVMQSDYPFRDTIMHGGDVVAMFSKFPIHGKERIHFESKGNVSAAFRVQIQGRTVIVVNNHLESTGLSPEEKSDFKLMVKGDLPSDTARHVSKMLIRQLGNATKKRAPQAEAVARFIAYHRGTPIIVCGDFNDSPVSYVHRTIAKGLTDCYVATGIGPGISYHLNGIYVRIDNILCTDDFTPYNCHIDRSIKASDHYPIACWLKMSNKH
jgi:endonuclease/exonuclease/phosphatase (EEP) superfamily protein YafD